MAHLTTEQLEKLQTLANIKLDASQQEDFLQKLDPVIVKLEELNKVDTSNIPDDITTYNSLRVLEGSFEGEKQKEIAENIMKNVSHEVINNSVVIKSVLH